jgi:MFS family permease
VDLRLFRPLRHRDYRLLTAGSLVSLFGDGVFIASIALQVYRLSDLPSALSAVAAIVIVSQAATLLIGGWAADRYDRRVVLLATDVVRGLAIGTMGVLSVTGVLELWHVWVLVAVHGIANGFFNPTSTAFIPDLVPDEDLEEANALLAAGRPIARTLAGPAVGGVLVAVAGPGVSFLIDGATFAFSALMLALIRTGGAPEADDRPSLPLQVAEGLRFVRTHAWCRTWILGQAIGMLGFLGPFEVLVPYVFRFEQGLSEQGAALALGSTLAVGGLGAIVVSLAIGQFRLPRRLPRWMYLAEGTAVALLAVFGLMTGVWQALVASFFLQGLYAFTEVGEATLYQRNVPGRLLGRVSSVSWLASLSAALVSVAVAGPLAQLWGARPVLLGGAALGSLGLWAMLLVRDTDPAAPTAADPPAPPVAQPSGVRRA